MRNSVILNKSEGPCGKILHCVQNDTAFFEKSIICFYSP